MSHIHFPIPYSFERKLFEAYDYEFSKIDNSEDWVCLMDADMLFFQSYFGHIIQNHVENNPNTGLFTCYTNQIGNPVQLYSAKAKRIDSAKYHFNIAKSLEKQNKGLSTLHRQRVAGFLMVIKKATWNAIRDDVAAKCQGQNILGVDYMIADVMNQRKYEIRRMEDLYVFHYRRLSESTKEKGLQ